MNASNNQFKAIYTLLKIAGLADFKDEIITGYSNGRTASVRGLESTEAADVIQHLQNLVNGSENKISAIAESKMKNKILAMAHEMGWEKSDGKIDMQRVNNWCSKWSSKKKKLDEYSLKELPKLVSQFEGGPYFHFRNCI